MKTYISMLRGINVSGKNIIKMEALRELYADLGFQETQTYIQSGNVVFKTQDFPADALAKMIHREIENRFNFKIPVIVLTSEMLQRIISNNPFLQYPEKDPSFFHITFLSEEPKEIDISSWEEKKQEGEAFFMNKNAIYLYCPKGYGNTKLNNNYIEKRLKVVTTTRNWKTTLELQRIASEK